MSLTMRVLAGLVLGLAAGLLVLAHPTPVLLAVVRTIAPIGTLWVNAIRMTVVPLVFALLVTGIAGVSDMRTVRVLGAQTLATFVGLLLLSTVVALLVVPALFAGLHVDAAGRAPVAAAGAAAGGVPGFAEWISAIVPVNPVQAAAAGDMLPFLVFAIAFGLALLTVAPDRRDAVVGVLRGVGDAMLAIVRFVIALSPVGVFALMLSIASRTGLAAAGALAYYVAAAAAAHVILILALYPLAPLVGRVPVVRFARAAFPAQAVAVATSSSLATLPALIDSADRRLDLPIEASGVVLPLAVSTFKLAAPVVWMVAAVFLARFYGVTLTAGQIAVIATTAGLTSFSTPGVPHGALLVMTPLIVTMGIPAEGIGLLIAVDAVPDIGATTVNVTGDLLASAIVMRGRRASPMRSPPRPS